VEPSAAPDVPAASPPSQSFGEQPAYPTETRHEDTARTPEPEPRPAEFQQPEFREAEVQEYREPPPREPEFREPEFREPEFREPEFPAPEPRAEPPVETRFEPQRDAWSPPPEETRRRDELRESAEPAGESPTAGPDERPSS
jgi:hypothetical protein